MCRVQEVAGVEPWSCRMIDHQHRHQHHPPLAQQQAAARGRIHAIYMGHRAHCATQHNYECAEG